MSSDYWLVGLWLVSSRKNVINFFISTRPRWTSWSSLFTKSQDRFFQEFTNSYLKIEKSALYVLLAGLQPATDWPSSWWVLWLDTGWVLSTAADDVRTQFYPLHTGPLPLRRAAQTQRNGSRSHGSTTAMLKISVDAVDDISRCCWRYYWMVSTTILIPPNIASQWACGPLPPDCLVCFAVQTIDFKWLDVTTSIPQKIVNFQHWQPR